MVSRTPIDGLVDDLEPYFDFFDCRIVCVTIRTTSAVTTILLRATANPLLQSNTTQRGQKSKRQCLQCPNLNRTDLLYFDIWGLRKCLNCRFAKSQRRLENDSSSIVVVLLIIRIDRSKARGHFLRTVIWKSGGR